MNEILDLFFNSEFYFRMRDYFFSVYENSLLDLGIFTCLLFTVFVVRNIFLKHAIKKARQNIPLVIGGWGTRGKSSVERLKGAVFNALGYSVLSKTTGCEAMFLHAHPYSQMREMFIFRPYDKATIWEQHDLTRLTRKLNCHVFLWECMGLTPAYVRVLQREWMMDDLSTITNTYPDHEDLQGPAGIDIPEVMTNFIPKSSILVTSEEQMLPILDNAAQALNTRIQNVNWLQAGLITSDILQRFSYEEHPYNVALVLSMAHELGIEKDFAIKEMADRVIPDIGVLKIYPVAPVKTRKLEFVSGMSANERFGALSNWERTAFDKHDRDKDPEVWITTVVNNRADRIPRSRVFGYLLVEDVSVDRHILIGSNLTGLQGFIDEALDEYVGRITLKSQDDVDTGSDPQKLVEKYARKLRVPVTQDQVKARFHAMLKDQEKILDIKKIVNSWEENETLKQALCETDLEPFSDKIMAFLEQDRANLDEFQMFSKKIAENSGDYISLDNEFRVLIKKWFIQKLVFIWDYHASGNQIIQQLIDHTPPGLYNRIMMLQNIKGTGLDFVYTWQAWERCYHACEQLKSDDASEVEQGLKILGAFQEYGLLSDEYVRKTIDIVKGLPVSQTERLQAELNMIISNLDNVLNGLNTNIDTGPKYQWLKKIFDFIEEIQDAGDAVKRRKIANQIYKDLADERVSHQRAAIELQVLNKRQKGGWLYRQLYEKLRLYQERMGRRTQKKL